MMSVREKPVRGSRHAASRQSARGVRRAQPRFNAESRAALAESDEILCAIRNGLRTPQTLDAFLAEMSAL